MINGSEHEINFWKGLVKTERFQQWLAPVKTPELNNSVYEFILKQKPRKVLDCGSGVCSILTGTVPNDKLIACDLLADEYAKIFDYSKYDVFRPFPLGCEELQWEDEFDIVHISNALDHTQNPMLSFQKLYQAVAPGGWLIIQSFENEGKHENWKGFHQWNLHVETDYDLGPTLVIESKNGQPYVCALTNYEVIPVKHLKRNWFIAKLHKPDRPRFDPDILHSGELTPF